MFISVSTREKIPKFFSGITGILYYDFLDIINQNFFKFRFTCLFDEIISKINIFVYVILKTRKYRISVTTKIFFRKNLYIKTL